MTNKLDPAPIDNDLRPKMQEQQDRQRAWISDGTWTSLKSWFNKLYQLLRGIQSDSKGNIIILGSLSVGGVGAPTVTSGAGAPTSTQPNASIYLRTDGTTGARLYVSAGSGTWNAVAGV